MDHLEKYIAENRVMFDQAPVPEGCRERFMRKAKRTPVRKVLRAGVSVAAVSILLVAFHFNDESRRLNRMLEDMARHEGEIRALVETSFPQDMDAVDNTLRSITSEAIPMVSLLPDEISSKERMRILADYYGTKMQALDKVMQYYEDQMINEL